MTTSLLVIWGYCVGQELNGMAHSITVKAIWHVS